MKKCNRCGKQKDITQFHKNCGSSDGHYSLCKECAQKNSRKYYKAVEKQRRDNPEYRKKRAKKEKIRRKKQLAKDPYFRVAERHRAIAKELGIEYDDLEKWYTHRFLKQQARCAICGKITESLCIDHDHTSGKLRGLLCHNCNLGLGYFKDSSEFLRNVVVYLEAA